MIKFTKLSRLEHALSVPATWTVKLLRMVRILRVLEMLKFRTAVNIIASVNISARTAILIHVVWNLFGVCLVIPSWDE